jgi:type I restriction enzyme M protein
MDIQKKIVAEIEAVEDQEEKTEGKIKNTQQKIERLFKNAYNEADMAYRLTDDAFSVSIGKRVIESELAEEGEIPVYSANVFDPFGFIDKYLITDFSVPSVIWGIDGDWMVNYIPAEKPFYPTDHCGVIRINNNTLVPKYLAWALNKEGKQQGFSRKLRASIGRIQGLVIKFPPLAEQKKIADEVEKLETEIQNLQERQEQMKIQKELIVKK